MMMQMLAAGGMPILTDGVRAPDEDNPRGYLEFEPVKNTKADPSWVPTAVGKAVKMVTVLLRDLPAGFDYRVILMRRDPDEVLQSQKAMLVRLGRSGAQAGDEHLKELFSRDLSRTIGWLEAQPMVRYVALDYATCIRDPRHAAAVVSELLDRKVNAEAMVQAVDAALYRKKSFS